MIPLIYGATLQSGTWHIFDRKYKEIGMTTTNDLKVWCDDQRLYRRGDRMWLYNDATSEDEKKTIIEKFYQLIQKK